MEKAEEKIEDSVLSPFWAEGLRALTAENKLTWRTSGQSGYFLANVDGIQFQLDVDFQYRKDRTRLGLYYFDRCNSTTAWFYGPEIAAFGREVWRLLSSQVITPIPTSNLDELADELTEGRGIP